MSHVIKCDDVKSVSAPLRDLIIRCVVLLGGLLIYDIALYCYYKVLHTSLFSGGFRLFDVISEKLSVILLI